MTKQEKKLLRKLKSSAISLRAQYMLPLSLVKFINKLDDHSSEKEIYALMELSEQYIRIKGFYKRYPQIEAKYNQEITELLTIGN